MHQVVKTDINFYKAIFMVQGQNIETLNSQSNPLPPPTHHLYVLPLFINLNLLHLYSSSSLTR